MLFDILGTITFGTHTYDTILIYNYYCKMEDGQFFSKFVHFLTESIPGTQNIIHIHFFILKYIYVFKLKSLLGSLVTPIFTEVDFSIFNTCIIFKEVSLRIRLEFLSSIASLNVPSSFI